MHIKGELEQVGWLSTLLIPGDANQPAGLLEAEIALWQPLAKATDDPVETITESKAAIRDSCEKFSQQQRQCKAQHLFGLSHLLGRGGRENKVLRQGQIGGVSVAVDGMPVPLLIIPV